MKINIYSSHMFTYYNISQMDTLERDLKTAERVLTVLQQPHTSQTLLEAQEAAKTVNEVAVPAIGIHLLIYL